MVKKKNRLAKASSPYLLQHADNPVDWYSWGEEAFTKAQQEEKPILLSIGYSACHWCHVMARESFGDKRTASLMNEHFVNIKVDKEERPDIDDAYMIATLIMTQGHGGWPMTLFLTPDGKPFFAGTYFPPSPQGETTDFPSILKRIAKAWREQRSSLVRQAEMFTLQLQGSFDNNQLMPISSNDIDTAYHALHATFDPIHGGFSKAPKFPTTPALSFLINYYQTTKEQTAYDMVVLTLDKMAHGGIYDQLGGGFARYAVDEEWHVPHFEKMLYDNALLATTYLEAYQLTNKPLYKEIAKETIDFILEELAADEGAFYSAIDADSEGEEGKFYLWKKNEIDDLLKKDSALFCSYYDVSEEGNWECSNVLHVKRSLDSVAEEQGISAKKAMQILAKGKKKLLAVRNRRIRPATDDKIVASWNALAINALATGAVVLENPRYCEAAEKAMAFISKEMMDRQGRISHTWRCKKRQKEGFLEDHAYIAQALVTLYETTGKKEYLEQAEQVTHILLTKFREKRRGSFTPTAQDQEKLYIQTSEGTDDALPNANSIAAHTLLHLFRHTQKEELLHIATEALTAYGSQLSLHPHAFCSLLIAVNLCLSSPSITEITGKRSYIGSLTIGKATEEGTAKAASQRNNAGYRLLANTGLLTSSIGFGCYRIEDDEPLHDEAIALAINKGCNLIETSTNYSDGSSEKAIGKVLHELLQEETVERNELIIISKTGYVQGALLNRAKEKEKKGAPYPEVVKYAPDCWHCMHPSFIEEQVEQSRLRLQVETIDAYLIHNPEYFFMAQPYKEKQAVGKQRQLFYHRLKKAFKALEKCVERGLIQYYGVSSNTAILPADHPDATSLVAMLQAAKEAGGENHHFKILELPLNIIENNATLLHNNDGKTVLEYAKEHAVAILANRPLNALYKNQL
ncbi:DUF255 domain-containing protein, partial [Simkania negevensis]|nr:DUF255 domain-containing protein [Simkania negevensis]